MNSLISFKKEEEKKKAQANSRNAKEDKTTQGAKAKKNMEGISFLKNDVKCTKL